MNAGDEDGWTPLHAAVHWGNIEIAEKLMANGADLDRKTKSVHIIVLYTKYMVIYNLHL